MLAKIWGDDDTKIQVGVDEAGRGSLAFGVTAAAVVWNNHTSNQLVNEIKDSKLLSSKKRSKLKTFIEEEGALCYGVCTISAERIDEINILQATYEAMHGAISQVVSKIKVDRILVDGNRFKPYEQIPYECVVGGDNLYLPIAAASIIAKTTRDEHIQKIYEEQKDTLEAYSFGNNKGYGTRVHVEALREYGLTPYHRKSFVVKALL